MWSFGYERDVVGSQPMLSMLTSRDWAAFTPFNQQQPPPGMGGGPLLSSGIGGGPSVAAAGVAGAAAGSWPDLLQLQQEAVSQQVQLRQQVVSQQVQLQQQAASQQLQLQQQVVSQKVQLQQQAVAQQASQQLQLLSQAEARLASLHCPRGELQHTSEAEYDSSALAASGTASGSSHAQAVQAPNRPSGYQEALRLLSGRPEAVGSGRSGAERSGRPGALS